MDSLTCLLAANTLQKLPINFTKFNENSMEAKSQQNFYNKAAIVLISSKPSLWSIHFQDPMQKVTKWLTIIHYFRCMLCIAFTLSSRFSSWNPLGTCVQDMKSCPTPAVESSKIHNGFDTAGS